jgi:hypothetical protein
MGAGNPRITVSVSDWRRKMHSARGRQAYMEGNGARRKAGARKPRWGSTATSALCMLRLSKQSNSVSKQPWGSPKSSISTAPLILFMELVKEVVTLQ